eukprot:15366850-Ditylum_brightwellii.AAC.2
MIAKSLFVTPHDIALVAWRLFAKHNGYACKSVKWTDKEICQSIIGTSHIVCSEIWNLVQVPIVDTPADLESAIREALEQNIIKWPWLPIEAVSSLKTFVSKRERAKAWIEKQFGISLPTRKQKTQRSRERAKAWSGKQFQKCATSKTSISNKSSSLTTLQSLMFKEEEPLFGLSGTPVRKHSPKSIWSEKKFQKCATSKTSISNKSPSLTTLQPLMFKEEEELFGPSGTLVRKHSSEGIPLEECDGEMVEPIDWQRASALPCPSFSFSSTSPPSSPSVPLSVTHGIPVTSIDTKDLENKNANLAAEKGNINLKKVLSEWKLQGEHMESLTVPDTMVQEDNKTIGDSTDKKDLFYKN